jgi:hypothetical protein
LHFNLLGIPALLKPACFGCARDAFWLLGIKKTYKAGSIWIARNAVMSGIVLTGAALSLLGIIGLMLCIAKVVKAKKRSLSDEEMRAELAACYAHKFRIFVFIGRGIDDSRNWYSGWVSCPEHKIRGAEQKPLVCAVKKTKFHRSNA